MIMSLRDHRDIPYAAAKQEAGGGDSTKLATASSSGSRQWSGFKNPRIVRVSRSFGGKDRHSKVCTIKGLRDRRIRLSVPTAIQLYDLQDRLGLSQPSKVIDWLLDNTKNEIDKLPPLPMVPGAFGPFHQATYPSHQGYGVGQSNSPFLDATLLSSRKEGININCDQSRMDVDDNEDDHQSLVARLKYWESNNAMMRSKQKEVGDNNSTSSQVSAQNFFPIASGGNNTSILPPPSLLSNSNPMLNYYHWEPNSNLSLTQLGSHNGLPDSQNDHQSNSSSSIPSSLSLSSAGSQLYLYPSMGTTSLFPHHASFMNNAHHQLENDLRQFNRFQMSNSIHNSSDTGLGLKPFPLSMNHHQNHDESQQDKGDHGS